VTSKVGFYLRFVPEIFTFPQQYPTHDWFEQARNGNIPHAQKTGGSVGWRCNAIYKPSFVVLAVAEAVMLAGNTT
jgi:hypothetical protein